MAPSHASSGGGSGADLEEIAAMRAAMPEGAIGGAWDKTDGWETWSEPSQARPST